MKSALVRFFQRFDVRWQFYRRVKESRKILELGCGSGLNYRNLRLLASPADFYGVGRAGGGVRRLGATRARVGQ